MVWILYSALNDVETLCCSDDLILFILGSLLLCHAGLASSFHCSASIHLKEGKPPARRKETQRGLRAGLSTLSSYGQIQIYAAFVVERFAKRSIAQAQRGISQLAAVPRFQFPSFDTKTCPQHRLTYSCFFVSIHFQRQTIKS